jgi:hyaluronate lyase
MPSRRSIAYESMNGKHGDGWYTGDGALYLYTPTGFDEFSPKWWQGADKLLIPGTTVEEREREIMFFNCGWRPNRDFVGGVCLDGEYLTAGMDHESFHNEHDEGRPDTGAGRSLPVYHCTLTSSKSWFFFNKAILCLGCEITANDGYAVRTVVENRALEGDEFIVADGKVIEFEEGEISLSTQRIFIPHTGGFIFPEGGDIKVRFYENCGVRYVALWLDHRVDPKGEKYAYIVLPNATESETSRYDTSDIEILRNDGAIQSAKERSSGLCGIVFRAAEEIRSIKADHPMIAMLQEKNDEITSLTVCDPTQIRTDISLSVKGDPIRIETDRARGKGYKII